MQFERTLNRAMSRASDFERPHDAELGRGVVRLPEVADEPRGRRHVDEAAGTLRPEPGRCGPRGVEAPLEVHADDRVPVVLGHLVEDGIAENPRVVDDDVDPPEALDRLLDHPLRGGEIHDAVEVRLRLAARVANGGDRLQRRDPVLAVAGGGAARIVHDHLRAVRSQHLRNLGADAASGAGDQRDLSFNHPGHEALPRRSRTCLVNRATTMPPARVLLTSRSRPVLSPGRLHVLAGTRARPIIRSTRDLNNAAANAPGGPATSPAPRDRRARSRTRRPRSRRRAARRARSSPPRCRRWR